MLFQMHAKLPDRAGRLDALYAIELVLTQLEDAEYDRSGAIPGENGEVAGFWSITDANEDPRIARVRAIAENLNSPLQKRGAELIGHDDIAAALLAAIDGNPHPLEGATDASTR